MKKHSYINQQCQK